MPVPFGEEELALPIPPARPSERLPSFRYVKGGIQIFRGYPLTQGRPCVKEYSRLIAMCKSKPVSQPVICLSTPWVRFTQIIQTITMVTLVVLFASTDAKTERIISAMLISFIIYIPVSYWTYQNNIDTEIGARAITCTRRLGPFSRTISFSLDEIGIMNILTYRGKLRVKLKNGCTVDIANNYVSTHDNLPKVAFTSSDPGGPSRQLRRIKVLIENRRALLAEGISS
jgi:hypothetical protein